MLFYVFTILGIIAGFSFFIGEKKFSPIRLLLAVWLLAIGIGQLNLSPLESSWGVNLWLILGLFFSIFFVVYYLFENFLLKRVDERWEDWQFNNKIIFWVLLSMFVLSVASNVYIFFKFGTLPILSSDPERTRFLINDQIFGLWEYLALLPRIFIPLTFIYLIIQKPKILLAQIFGWLNIILGFLILSLYTSRATIIFALLICYFSYLIIRKVTITYPKIISATAVVVLAVILISVAIPAFRHQISFRDAYDNEGAFGYLMDLSQLQIPEDWSWITPVYIIPAFNLEAMNRAGDYFDATGSFYGTYHLSVLEPIWPSLKADINWEEMFLPWWVTATFLFSWWVDFGYFGILLAAIIWGLLLSGIYVAAFKKQSPLTVLLYAYFGFVIVMTIYTDYFMRPEFYLDLVLILGLTWFLRSRPVPLVNKPVDDLEKKV